MRSLDSHHHKGSENALKCWWKKRNPALVIINFLVIYLAGFSPSMALKRVMYRSIGMKIGKDTCIGLMAMFDVFYPELIEIGDNCIIGYGATLLAHDVSVTKWRTGKVRIGNNVLIGANSTLLAGVTVGDNSIVSAMSLVNKDVQKNSMVGGVPARFIRRC
ncbi:MAG TPA: acyltransferase [Candidatus Nanoarchaeia archaeon]|nr:acyltransferase [Candidatus Nanoarchaeia archaeon]